MLRVWIGTWNVGAEEPFEASSGLGPRMLRESFMCDEKNADIYFLGWFKGHPVECARLLFLLGA